MSECNEKQRKNTPWPKTDSAPPVPGILQGGQQVSSTILMYTEKRRRGTILVAIESM